MSRWTTIYLPDYISEFGPDVAFWRRPASAAYLAVLEDFIRLEAGPEPPGSSGG